MHIMTKSFIGFIDVIKGGGIRVLDRDRKVIVRELDWILRDSKRENTLENNLTPSCLNPSMVNLTLSLYPS